MANITLFVPDELKKKMDRHTEIRWSAAIRAIIEQKLEDLEEVEAIMSRSKLTARDVEMLAEEVNKKAGKRAEELLNEISRRR